VRELPTADAARAELVASWSAARDTGAHTTMVALRRSDVVDLNARARRMLQERGDIGGPELVTPTGRFAVGDSVMASRNRRQLGLINGTIGEVVHIDTRAAALTIRTTDARQLLVPTDYLADGHLAHAYAISIHKAQGMTCDVSFVLGDDQLYLEAGYTALSRGRQRNELFVVAATEPDCDTATLDDNDIVAALSRSRAQTLATDLQRRKTIGVEL